MGQTKSPNTRIHDARLTPAERTQSIGQRGVVFWLTGLSGSGKSTIAYAAEERLVRDGKVAFVLDGDNLRHGLCGDLGFSEADRKENMRRVAEVARLFADANVITLVSLVSPYATDREQAKYTIGAERFYEVHVATPLEVCEARDPKGLYQKARSGKLTGMTGVDAPFETPTEPALRLTPAALDEQVSALLALLSAS